jgi:hypothetical protein
MYVAHANTVFLFIAIIKFLNYKYR